MPDFSSALALLTSPAILFFFIGAAAALARSDLTIPEPVAKALSLYLMFCIGFKGGVEARAAGLNGDFIAAGVIGVALSALMPLVAFIILKRTSRLDRPTLCALAATYGSVSVVTFAAGQQHLTALGLAPGGSTRGVAYRIAADDWDRVYAYLREREQPTESAEHDDLAQRRPWRPREPDPGSRGAVDGDDPVNSCGSAQRGLWRGVLGRRM